MTTRIFPSGDDGMTLVEIMVAMVIMAFLGALTDGALVQIYHSISSATAAAEAQTQINTAFLRLDREVRYARGLSTPATVNGNFYVEYSLTLDTTDTCVELRLNTTANTLQRRQWTKTSGTPVPTAWQTLAASVYPVTSTTAVFTVTNADSKGLTGFRYQRLNLDLISVVAAGNNTSSASATGGATRETNVTFTALNATENVSTTCTEAQGIA